MKQRTTKTKRLVIINKQTGAKVVINNQATFNATIVDYILAKKNWLLSGVKVKHLTNSVN